MACPCCGAVTRAIIGSVVPDAGNTFLGATPDSTVNAVDKEKISLIFKVGVPSAGAALPVFVVVNGENVPVYDKYGNKLLGVSIKTRKNLHAYFGTNGAEGAHLQLTNFPWCEC